MFNKNLLAAAVVSAGMMGSGVAVAGPVTVELDYTGPSVGFESGAANGSNTPAGQFDFNIRNGVANDDIDWSAITTLEAFCIDLDNTLIQSWTEYELKTADDYFASSANTSGIISSLDALYGGYKDQTTTSANSAAFQLAIWEILGEEGQQPYDLSSGGFVAGDYSNDADGIAAGWLSDLGAATGYQFFVLDSTSSHLTRLRQDNLRRVFATKLS